jgi:PAS domain S-box-containing protein
MWITPELHATILGGATISALLFSGFILARNPQSTPARMHAVYGGVAAWWFFCMAMVATSGNTEEVQRWSRLAHLAIGMFPAVMYHLNVATAGRSHEHRTGVRVHYGLSVAVTVFCVSWPDLLATPHQYSWGPYPSYTLWGLVPVSLILMTFIQVLWIYRKLLEDAGQGTAYREKARAFYHGNAIAALAMVDFFPVFGLALYPFGFAVMTLMNAATAFGSVRYRLIEITAEYAAEPILETLPDGVLVVDSEGLIRVANEAAARIFGSEVAALINRPVAETVSEPELLKYFTLPITSSVPEREVSFEGGEDRLVMRLSDALLHDQAGEPVARVWVLHDLTDQRVAEAEKDRLEGWIRHNQKLETLGVMAGGIAHDFNNILAAILGSADIARTKLSNGFDAEKELGAIATASQRAAELTKQLLTYAGRGATVEVPVSLNALTLDITDLMKTAISKKAVLELQLAEDLPLVLGDESQLSQVILNLVTNASDALGNDSGSITLSTGTLQAVDESAASSQSEFVSLVVTDTGAGMDQETLDRMFDPFFTTKFTGRGLGLATVMGIVKAHGGRIRVDSTPGQGTTLTVALPPAPAGTTQASTVEATTSGFRGSGLALVADDEPTVRLIAHHMLEQVGFSVIDAADGQEAIDLAFAHKSEIRLILLDVTMPKMNGKEAFAQIRAVVPEVPIVFMTGYSESAIAELIADHRTAFLPKPFRAEALMQKLHEVMPSVAQV